MDVMHFNVLGIETDVLVTSESTNDSFSICRFDCKPGDGPPPHQHAFGDEVFMVLSGEFEVFDGYAWKAMPKGIFWPVLRDAVHTFRNSGPTVGRLLSVGVSGRHDLFLKEIAPLAMPQDARQFMEISERYGISYPAAEGGEVSSGNAWSAQNLALSDRLLVGGEDVEITVRSEATAGRLMALTQTSPPGGGVPIHTHLFEDELFSILEGEYEFFDGNSWRRYAKGEVCVALRGQPHAFRNCGQTDGKIHAMAIPGTGLEGLLTNLSGLRMPDDIEKFMDISHKYGITFV